MNKLNRNENIQDQIVEKYIKILVQDGTGFNR